MSAGNMRDKWPVVAAAGIGIGITLWTMRPDSEKNEREMKTNITRSTARICKAINVYDKTSSKKRNEVLEKNEKIRSQITKAEVVGETLANYELLRKSVDNLAKTFEYVQRVKAEQDQTPKNEPVEDVPEISQLVDDSELKIATDSESEPEEEEEEVSTLGGQLESVASILGTGIQRMSGIASGLFFGSQRRLSTSARRQSTS